MPGAIDQIKINDILNGKLARVMGYWKLIEMQTFGNNFAGGRNKMAMAVLYCALFNDLRDYIQQHESTWDNSNDYEVITRLDQLIDLYNRPDAYWKQFWNGDLGINPARIDLMINSEIVQINLFEIQKMAF